MKVICIDGKIRPNEFPGEMPIEGNEYTVIEFVKGIGTDYNQYDCYALKEIGVYPDNLYDCDRFIPISSIDETEFVRNCNKELV